MKPKSPASKPQQQQQQPPRPLQSRQQQQRPAQRIKIEDGHGSYYDDETLQGEDIP
eukprot:CAMPEP_0181110496 /NCGR_PEP_ID=MMETSP1071-20121207/18750_1 /TAXON_ID=35127 /ORGANISM="Thalassiosira sp., Strain NH16" /LENGTH=55 /DNA_ID=CAMNT_0023194281 /DNA_START=53 /DNA_END=216 /DNA_ORIENTATION=-